jgi:ABC-2 type transport system permease protein
VLGFAFQGSAAKPSLVGIMEPGSAALQAALGEDEMLSIEVFDEEALARRELQKSTIDVLVFPGEKPKLVLNEERAEAELARVRVLRALELAQNKGPRADVEIVPVTENGSRYVDFLFPGLIGMNLMGTGLWSIGFAVADTRRRKLLKRLLVTPMVRANFFLSFMISRLVFLVLELGVLTSVGHFALGVPFRCNLLAYFLVAMVGAACFAGIGILIASRAKTIEAVSGLMNLVMMPMWLGSGIFFSYERFPEGLQPVLRALPLTGLIDALRGMMLDGDGLMQVWPALLVQALWAGLAFLLALRIFRWQ